MANTTAGKIKRLISDKGFGFVAAEAVGCDRAIDMRAGSAEASVSVVNV